MEFTLSADPDRARAALSQPVVERQRDRGAQGRVVARFHREPLGPSARVEERDLIGRVLQSVVVVPSRDADPEKQAGAVRGPGRNGPQEQRGGQWTGHEQVDETLRGAGPRADDDGTWLHSLAPAVG